MIDWSFCILLSISRPLLPRFLFIESAESAIICNSWRTKFGITSIPSRKDVSQISAILPSIITLVSSILYAMFFSLSDDFTGKIISSRAISSFRMTKNIITAKPVTWYIKGLITSTYFTTASEVTVEKAMFKRWAKPRPIKSPMAAASKSRGDTECEPYSMMMIIIRAISAATTEAMSAAERETLI